MKIRNYTGIFTTPCADGLGFMVYGEPYPYRLGEIHLTGRAEPKYVFSFDATQSLVLSADILEKITSFIRSLEKV